MREHSTRARVLFFLEIEKVAKLVICETVIPKRSSREGSDYQYRKIPALKKIASVSLFIDGRRRASCL